jgi:hypothetical protein
MTTNVQAPIATDKDRSAIAYLASRIRPDLDAHGIAARIAHHPEQSLDVLTLQTIIAAVTRPDQKTPAILGLDGDHTNRARVALSKPVSVTSKIPGYAPLDPACGYPGCGVRKGKHLAHMIPGEIRPHEFEQPRPITPASPDTIRAARPEFHKGDPE